MKKSLGRGLDDISEVFLSKADEDEPKENLKAESSKKIRDEDCSSCIHLILPNPMDAKCRVFTFENEKYDVTPKNNISITDGHYCKYFEPNPISATPIVKPEILQPAENELFASIITSFDENQIEKLFHDTYSLLAKEKIQFINGQTIVYNNQIAYKLDYKFVAEISVLLDRMGKFRGFTEPGHLRYLSDEKTEPYDGIIDSKIIEIKEAEFLQSLSGIVSKRTINDLLRKRYQLVTIEKIIYKRGEIVVLNDRFSYQFLYEADVIFSILIDGKGNYINLSKENHGTTLKVKEYTEKTGLRLGTK